MKELFTLFLTISSMFALTQNKNMGQSPPDGYVIRGELKGAETSKIYLREASYFKPENAEDSTVSDKSGKFIFKGNLQEDAPFIITVNGKTGSRFFILENSKISITGKADSLSNTIITGSNEETIWQKLNDASIEAGTINLFELYIDAKSKYDTTAIRTIEAQIDSMSTKIREFISSYPTSFASIELLGIPVNMDRIEEADGYLQKFKQSSIRNSEHLKFFEKLIGIRKNLILGKTAPTFTQIDISGNPIDLSSFRGEFVLLDFWASWCLPCRKEHPGLLNIYKRFSQKNFTIVSVSIDEDKDSWVHAIEKDGLLWTQLSDLKGQNNSVYKMYGVTGIPDNYLIDPNGKIIGKRLYRGELSRKLEAVLK